MRLNQDPVRNSRGPESTPELVQVAEWIEDARFEQALATIESELAACAEEERPNWRQLRSRALRLLVRAHEPLALEDALCAAQAARSSGDNRRVVSAFFDLGALRLMRSENEESEAALAESLAACAIVGEPADAERADVLVYLAECASDRGDRTRARALLGEAAGIQDRVLDPLDPRAAFRRLREANLAHMEDDDRRAVELGTQALTAFRSRLRPGHPRIALALHNLGVYRQRLGDLPAAARDFEEALELRRAENSPLFGRTLMLLAQVREELGDGDAADRLQHESIDWIEGTGGPYAPALRTPLQALAISALRAGDAATAEPLVQRALGVLDRGTNTSALERAGPLELLGHVAWRLGERERAVSVWREALATLEPENALESSAAVDLLTDLGLAAAASGSPCESGEGADLLERAVAIQRRIVGDAHPDTARTLASYAEAASAAGRSDAAFAATLEAAAIVRRHLDASTPHLDERDALGYATELTPGLPLAVVLATEAPATRASAAWDALVAARAAVFESVRRGRAAALDMPARPSATLPAGATGIAAVARARSSGSAVVAYVRCTRPDAYVAFVLPAGSDEPLAFDLGSAVAIDALAAPACALARYAGSEEALREAAGALRARVWDPVAATLGDATEVDIVPDGALLLLDFAGLPVGDTEYLIETAPPIQVLGAERDLIAAHEKGPVPEAAGWRILAVGGPDFGAVSAAEPGSTSRSPRGVFAPLPKAAEEARDVADLWARNNAGVQVLVGAEATEPALREALRGVGILHIATHGFSTGSSGEQGTRGLAGTALEPAAPQLRLELSRRLLGGSGLALAGANARGGANPSDDGLFLDEDVLALDLGGLDLAILSACDSGAGEVQSGEGIFGLRRAFLMAGARAVVASSWPVADETARTIMTDFHARLARGGTTVARALHEAKHAELSRRRAARIDTHPWHWAGFVAAGEPLRIR
ncbi:MAG: CHAT domain-containing protein [Planctomycetota bacterium]|nr:CHAT domain-containing protein [Planctomycetota bacterium]